MIRGSKGGIGLLKRLGGSYRSGQTQVEYGLILAFVSIALIGSLVAMYVLDRSLFQSVIDAVKGLF
ncbi:MAG: Flp family type IVb pilin [Synergistales bacterium]